MDPLEPVYVLLRANREPEALEEILNFNSGRIRRPYNQDLNHAWYVVGDAYFRYEDFEQALRAFRTSLRNRPKDDQAMVAIASCYSELGKPILSERYLRKALQLKPGKDDYIYNLGNALYDQGKHDLAILEYEKVSKSEGDTYGLAQKNIHSSKKKLN